MKLNIDIPDDSGIVDGFCTATNITPGNDQAEHMKTMLTGYIKATAARGMLKAAQATINQQIEAKPPVITSDAVVVKAAPAVP